MTAFLVRSHPRRTALVLLSLLAAVTAIALSRERASAHGGHEHAEIGEFDLDAPRVLSPETAKHIGLKVEDVGTRPLEEVLEISGIVKADPDKHQLVVSRVSGKLVSVQVQVGSPVKKGDLLAEVDSPELAKNIYEVRKLEVEYEKLVLDAERRLGDVARLEPEIEALKSREALARADFDRSEKVSGDAISLRDVESRKAELARIQGELKGRIAEADVSRREAAALKRQAEALKLSRTAMLAIHNVEPTANVDQIGGVMQIRSAIDGVVVAREALPGQWMQAGDRILTVADYSTIQIEGELPESLIPRIEKRETQKVRIRAASDPGMIMEGSIKFIAPQLEPVKRTAHVIVDAPNPKGVLRGEAWVDLTIVLREKKSALAVPKSAVVTHGPMHFVFLEIESADPKTGQGAKYQKQDINPGLSSDQYVEVKDGIAPGDRVVTQGSYSLTQIRSKPAKATAEKTNSDGHGHSH